MKLRENQYDLIASLGANCAAAHNLEIRGLRPVALPFDWTYVVDESPYAWMAEHVCDGFRGLCMRENLVEITPASPEWKDAHADRVKYVDNGSGFRFVNHFSRPVDSDGEYAKVHSALSRRTERLFEMLGKSGRVLFVAGTHVRISPETFQALRRSFSARFPDVDFGFVYVRFATARDEVLPEYGEETRLITVERPLNDYDCAQANFEWSFMDSLELSGLFQRPRERLMHVSLGIWPSVSLHVELRRKRKSL